MQFDQFSHHAMMWLWVYCRVFCKWLQRREVFNLPYVTMHQIPIREVQGFLFRQRLLFE